MDTHTHVWGRVCWCAHTVPGARCSKWPAKAAHDLGLCPADGRPFLHPPVGAHPHPLLPPAAAAHPIPHTPSATLNTHAHTHTHIGRLRFFTTHAHALHRSSSTQNLTGLTAAASLARLLDEDLPPEPAVNLSNKLNPNNIHYDRELAAR